MKNVPAILLLLLLLLTYSASAQTFQTAIGYPLPTDERGVSGLITNAGDYLVLGGNVQHPSGFFNPAGDLQLVRLNNLGNLVNPGRIIGQDVAESAVWMEKATDCNGAAGYIIAANQYNGPGHDMLLTLTNAGGSPTWVRRIGTIADDERSACVKQDASGNFILVGTRTDAGTGLSTVHAVKTDCKGNLLWERIYDAGISVRAASVTAFATSMAACGNQPAEYFVTGTVSAAAGGNEEVFILSLNAATGSVSFMRTYDITQGADDVATCIQGNCTATPLANGGLWVSGYTLDAGGSAPKKVLLLQTDLNGNLVWANNYDVQNSPMEFATHFQFAANGKLVLTGNAEETGVSDPPETGQCLLMRVSDDGNSLDWTRIFRMGFSARGNRVEPNPADEYFISGYTFEIVQPQQFDYNILAIKTDHDGQTTGDCYHSPVTEIIHRSPKMKILSPVVTMPQDFFPTSLLNVVYQDKQTFCPQQNIDPCDTLALNASFIWSLSGTTVTFSDQSTVGSGSIFSWTWDFGDSNTGSGPNPTHTYATPGTYTVCLVITGGTAGALCRDTICRDIVIKPVATGCLCDSSFFAAVAAGFTTSGSNPVGFTPVALDTCDQVEWLWGDASPSTFSSANTTVFHTYSLPGAYSVCMVVTRVASDGTVCKFEHCTVIQVSGEPEVCPGNLVLNGDFSQGLTAGNLGSGGTCANWSTWTNSPQVILFDTCQDAGAIQMWGDQVVGESIQQPVTFQQGGIYEVSFCGKWLPTVQDSVRFRFRASTGLPGSYLNCTGACDEIYLSPVLTTNWVTYTSAPWTALQNFNTLTISVWNNFAINDGAYVSWARIDDVCIRRIGTSAAGDLPGQRPVTMYPNPTGGYTTLEFGEAIPNAASFVVTDLLGRTVQQETLAAGSSRHTFSLENEPAGIYLVRLLENGAVVWTGKLIRE